MPNYELVCECGKKREYIGVWKDAKEQLCECGKKMKIKIGRTSFTIKRHRHEIDTSRYKDMP